MPFSGSSSSLSCSGVYVSLHKHTFARAASNMLPSLTLFLICQLLRLLQHPNHGAFASRAAERSVRHSAFSIFECPFFEHSSSSFRIQTFYSTALRHRKPCLLMLTSIPIYSSALDQLSLSLLPLEIDVYNTYKSVQSVSISNYIGICFCFHVLAQFINTNHEWKYWAMRITTISLS